MLSNFRNAGNAGTDEAIARCQPGYFFLPSLSVLLIFLPPAVHVQDGTDGAGQIGRGTQDFKKQVHRPLQSEIEALPADGFRGAFRFYPTKICKTAELPPCLEGPARCGNVYTFLAAGRPNATGVAGFRTDRRRAVPARTAGPRSRESGNREPQR